MTHDELVSWVKDNTQDVFGEKIHWDDSQKKVLGENLREIEIDLIGTDSENRTVIVEVKTEFNNDDSTNRRDASHKSVGQVLNYAYAFIRDKLTADCHMGDVLEKELKRESQQLRLFIY